MISRHLLNIAVRRQRNRRLLRNAWLCMHAWALPRPAESWFDMHYNDATIPQEYFRQQLRVNKDKVIRQDLGATDRERKFKMERLFATRESAGF